MPYLSYVFEIYVNMQCKNYPFVSQDVRLHVRLCNFIFHSLQQVCVLSVYSVSSLYFSFCINHYYSIQFNGNLSVRISALNYLLFYNIYICSSSVMFLGFLSTHEDFTFNCISNYLKAFMHCTHVSIYAQIFEK